MTESTAPPTTTPNCNASPSLTTMMAELSAYLVRQHAPHLEATSLEGLSLLRDGILQSIDVVDLVLYLEKQYGVKIPSSEVVPENFDSVAAICRLLVALAPVAKQEG